MKKILGILLLLFLIGCVQSELEMTNDESDTNVIADQQADIREEDEEPMAQNEEHTAMQEGSTMNTLEEIDASASVVDIDMIARQWVFEPEEIRVRKGDMVRLHIESIDVRHGIRIAEYGVSEFLTPGEVVDVEFIADKTGIFDFWCSVYCGSGHGGMRGQLIVQE